MNFLKLSTRLLCMSKRISVNYVNSRTLFSDETLRLTLYKKSRQDAHENVSEKERFKWDFKSYLENEKEPSLEHLKSGIEILVHLINPIVDDMRFLKDSLYAMNEHQFTKTTKHYIGNSVIKAFHTLNLPNDAIEFYTDPALHSFFDGFSSVHILLDLLYKCEKYEEIIQIDVNNRTQPQWKQTSFGKFIDVLVFGACYKLNTTQHYDYALKLWHKVGESNQFKKSVVFVAALALKQNNPAITLKILQVLNKHLLTQQIRVIALAQLGYFTDAFDLLELLLSGADFRERKISKEVFKKIQNAVEQCGTIDEQNDFKRIYNDFVTINRIAEESLDELICRPISSRILLRSKSTNFDQSPTSAGVNGETEPSVVL